MRSFWDHKNTITRDLTLFLMGVVLFAVIAALWFLYETFVDQGRYISQELERETARIDAAFNAELQRAEYLLETLGRQILQMEDRSPAKIYQLLRTFDSSTSQYSSFVWVNEQQKVTVLSSEGILERPVDVLDSSYSKKALIEPFKIHPGKPARGRFSKKLIIPMAMGLTDFTGHYVGAIMVGMDLDVLTDKIKQYISNGEVGFVILSDTYSVIVRNQIGEESLSYPNLMERLSEEYGTGKSGMLRVPSFFSSDRFFAYYSHSPKTQHILLTSYVGKWGPIGEVMLPRLMQLGFIVAFLISLLALVRYRIISPLRGLTAAAADIARGKEQVTFPESDLTEISYMRDQLHNIRNFIVEHKLIEEELVAKVLALKTTKDRAEVSDKARMEIFNTLRPELFHPLEMALNGLSILQEQLYSSPNKEKYASSLTRVEEGVARLLEMLHATFELTKLQNGETVSGQKLSDIRALTHKCIKLLQHTLNQEEISVTVITSEDMPKVMIHELHIMYIIMQFISTCVHAIPAGGELTVEAYFEEGKRDHLVILFKDNGTGLDTEHVARLWRTNEQGQRLHALAHEEQSITSFAKRIVNLHHGRLSIENSPGKDAVISLTFQL